MEPADKIAEKLVMLIRWVTNPEAPEQAMHTLARIIVTDIQAVCAEPPVPELCECWAEREATAT